MAIGQKHAARGEALCPETKCKLLRSVLATAVGVCIEGEINDTRTVAQLLKLARVQMRAERAGDVAKTCLPQHRIIEQPLDENHLGAVLNLFPSIQTALGAVEQAMGKGGGDAAPVEIDDVAAVAAGEHDAPVEGIAALRIEQAETL